MPLVKFFGVGGALRSSRRKRNLAVSYARICNSHKRGLRRRSSARPVGASLRCVVRFHLRTPRGALASLFGLVALGRCCHLPGFEAAMTTAASPYGSSRVGSESPLGCLSTRWKVRALPIPPRRL